RDSRLLPPRGDLGWQGREDEDRRRCAPVAQGRSSARSGEEGHREEGTGLQDRCREEGAHEEGARQEGRHADRRREEGAGEEDHPAGSLKRLLVAIGQKLPAWADTAYADFAKRFPPECRLELKALKAEPRDGKSAEQLMAAEAVRIEAALPKGVRRV